MEVEYDFFVGIDWATEAHQVCVLDPKRKVVWEGSVAHTGDAIAELADRLAKLGAPERTAVGIETPRGAIIETLIERQFAVFHINPKQLDRFRDRHTVAGAKDDRRDAFVLGDSLRTDLHCYRRIKVDDPEIIALREMVRVDEDLAGEENALTNRLREQLHRYFPQMLELSPSADEPWIWALLAKVPDPAAATKTKRQVVGTILKEHRIRRVDADEVLATLRKPALRVAPGTVEAARIHIMLLLPRLQLVRRQRTELKKAIGVVLERLSSTEAAPGQKCEHRDAKVLLSLPGVGKKVAATMLVEAPQALAERDYQALRAHAGIAPVTKASGKRSSVQMRHACNNRLRNALYHWARVASQTDPATGAHYAALRARGHSHGRALRGVADRLLRILMAMLRDRTLWDAEKPAKKAA